MNKQEIKNEIKNLKDRISDLEKRLNEPEYIDLGLPSGTLWATTNEDKEYTFNEAVEGFGGRIPKLWQLCELWENCKRKNGVFTGPNGNSIKLSDGLYWSSTPGDSCAYYLDSNDPYVYVDAGSRSCVLLVCLCKSKK